MGRGRFLRPPLFNKQIRRCYGGAYLLSVAALPSPAPNEGGYSFTTPRLVAESAVPVCAREPSQPLDNLATATHCYLLRSSVSPWPSCLRRWLGSLEVADLLRFA